LGVSGLDIEREGKPSALERDAKTSSGILALALNQHFRLSLPVILSVSSDYHEKKNNSTTLPLKTFDSYVM